MRRRGGWGGGREHHRLDPFFNMSQRFNPSPPPLPLFTHQAQLTRYQHPIYLTQGKSAPCATTRRAVQDARVSLTSTAVAPNADVHRALAAL